MSIIAAQSALLVLALRRSPLEGPHHYPPQEALQSWLKQQLSSGAGIGGLTTAIRLAFTGWEVKVYEQNESVGGKMGQIETDGFRWDTGPSVITMRHVLDELIFYSRSQP
jgi:heterodisulfide reductase subunit A-like polyferredoxin